MRQIPASDGVGHVVRYHFSLPTQPKAISMSFVQNNWMLILVFVLSGAMLLWPLIQRQILPAKDIGNLEATRLINSSNALLVDLRETREYAGGKLPNAIHIPLSQLGSRGAELTKQVDRPVVTYCLTGNRARSAVRALSQLGFKDIYCLRGGFRAWKDAGLPVET
jgi:rhodanese-related sulfurtransferase